MDTGRVEHGTDPTSAHRSGAVAPRTLSTLEPQHATPPSMVTPQVVPIPADSDANRSWVETGVGFITIDCVMPLVPVPVSPSTFHPQQLARPSALSTQA